MTLKKGSKGDDVKKLQSALGVTADGIFGRQTERAVTEFQHSHNLTANGVADDTTLSLIYANGDALNIISAPITNNIAKKKRAIKYLVIHYTAGSSSAPGRAMQTRNGHNVKGRDASADFCVDDATIVQENPDPNNYYCWSVGDGKGKYGVTNSNAINIEMCSTLKPGTSAKQPNHSGWSITSAVRQNTLKLAAKLMKQYNIPLENVIRHYDASRKSCPGIVGWNPNALFNPDGTKTNKKNTEEEWTKFKEELASML